MTNSYIYSSIMKESAPPNRWALLFFVVSLLWNHAVATDSELSQRNNGVSVSIVLCVAPPYYIFIYTSGRLKYLISISSHLYFFIE